MISKRLLCAAALAAATPTLAADGFIPSVNIEAGALGTLTADPWSGEVVPEAKVPMPGEEDGNDVYFVASSPESAALSDMLSWRWRFQGRFQVRRA